MDAVLTVSCLEAGVWTNKHTLECVGRNRNEFKKLVLRCFEIYLCSACLSPTTMLPYQTSSTRVDGAWAVDLAPLDSSLCSSSQCRQNMWQIVTSMKEKTPQQKWRKTLQRELKQTIHFRLILKEPISKLRMELSPSNRTLVGQPVPGSRCCSYTRCHGVAFLCLIVCCLLPFWSCCVVKYYVCVVVMFGVIEIIIIVTYIYSCR